MKPRHETEIKLEIRDRKGLKQRLKQVGFRVIQPRHFEGNLLFDFPDLRLRKGRRLLRVRFEDRRCFLTFKGAPLHSRKYKIRQEIETAVEDGRRLTAILESLGLLRTFRYEKFRTVYLPRGRTDLQKAPHLVLDETPFGDYLELEGPQRWIDETARQLGYRPEDYITLSYAALHRQKCLDQGKKPGDMVFPEHKC